MTYREFTIDPHWFEGFVFSHEAYDGGPGANDYRFGVGKTIAECKGKIDKYYFTELRYRVITEKTITKFSYLDDAARFVKRFGGVIQPYLNKSEFEFNNP